MSYEFTEEDAIAVYEGIIFETEPLKEDKRMRQEYNPELKVRKFEVSEDEIIQENLLN